MIPVEFINARVRAKETGLIDSELWQRLLSEQNLRSWQELLRETPYSLEGGSSSFDALERAINLSAVKLKQDLFGVFTADYSDLVWGKYDLHNIKLLLKMRFGYKDLRRFLVDIGTYSVDKLELAIVAQEKGLLENSVQSLVDEAIVVYEKSQSFFEMDCFLDRDYFGRIVELANSANAKIREYVQKQVDIANFKLWFYNNSAEAVQLPYFAGGQISTVAFSDGSLNKDQLIALLVTNVAIGEVVDEAQLERVLDDELSAVIFKERFVDSSILPILIFVRAKEVEWKNLKIAYLKQVKKMNKLTEYMRYTYV